MPRSYFGVLENRAGSALLKSKSWVLLPNKGELKTSFSTTCPVFSPLLTSTFRSSQHFPYLSPSRSLCGRVLLLVSTPTGLGFSFLWFAKSHQCSSTLQLSDSLISVLSSLALLSLHAVILVILEGVGTKDSICHV